MSGERGWLPLRALLRCASWGYGGAIALRNRYYDAGGSRVRRIDVPVISVGNLTTGGTGKTPLVIDVVQRLQRRGFRPAVVSRAYRSAASAVPDELALVRRRCGEVITVGEPDRVAGAGRAIAAGADVVVLDDAFQHRRIHRDLDIVLIDATRPFGYGRLLPRGLLREPRLALGRAHVLVISRADSVSPPELEALRAELRTWNARAPILTSAHRLNGIDWLDDRRGLRDLAGRSVFCAAGVGNFRAFERTVEQTGARIAGSLALPDHAVFDRACFRRLESALAGTHSEALVVTEKDLVKMAAEVWSLFPLPIAALSISIQFLDGDSDTFEHLLADAAAAAQRRSGDVHPQVSTC